MMKTEILLTMHKEVPRRLFKTMQLGGNMRQLAQMEDEGLICSQRRYRSGRQRDWFLSEEQHGSLSFLFGGTGADPVNQPRTDR
jgi:hypothetical protein